MDLSQGDDLTALQSQLMTADRNLSAPQAMLRAKEMLQQRPNTQESLIQKLWDLLDDQSSPPAGSHYRRPDGPATSANQHRWTDEIREHLTAQELAELQRLIPEGRFRTDVHHT